MGTTAKDVSNTLRGIVFDLDDTLVLSTVDYAKFKRLVIERIGSRGEDTSLYSPSETIVAIISRYEDRLRKSGMNNPEIMKRTAELDEIMDRVELENVGNTHGIPGAVRLLEMLRAKGLKIGVLTRGCERYATAALEKTGLLELVDEIECRSPNTPAKPHPAAYLRLIERLGLRKEETLFVGDHPIDAQCAKNAGVPFIAVETGYVPAGDLRRAGCIAVLKDVGELADWFSEALGN